MPKIFEGLRKSKSWYSNFEKKDKTGMEINRSFFTLMEYSKKNVDYPNGPEKEEVQASLDLQKEFIIQVLNKALP